MRKVHTLSERPPEGIAIEIASLKGESWGVTCSSVLFRYLSLYGQPVHFGWRTIPGMPVRCDCLPCRRLWPVKRARPAKRRLRAAARVGR